MKNLAEEIERRLSVSPSREVIEEVSHLIGGDADRFSVLWDVFCNAAPPLPHRAAWVMDVVTAAHPSLAARYASSIAARLPFLQHQAEVRACTKILARTPLPVAAIADLLPLVFAWLEDPQVQAAIRCHSMQVLYEISKLEPDIKRELAIVIEMAMEEGGPAIRARGKRILQKLIPEIRAMEMLENDGSGG